ncbi:hypothetical protein [Chryseobacterium shandongense]|uniref:hypothetical protein n=1 Tax=Chryseobacterium shandongense TaxID=1493872 RepID=UPI001E3A65D1|nr:hypothetical protein [Chryseobacterium shandongense]
MAQSFESYLATNRNTENHTLHISLNPDLKDKVSDESFIMLAQDYMQKIVSTIRGWLLLTTFIDFFYR